MYEYMLLLSLPARRELLYNNCIHLYDIFNIWYLLKLAWVHLLLTSQILYMVVKHMQEHVNNEYGSKLL